MGSATEEVNQNENAQHNNADEKTPFTEKEVSGDDVQIVKNGIENCENHSTSSKDKKGSIMTKLKNNAVYREKYLISLGIMWSFFVLGWTIGQFGPSFLDLRIITNASLKKAAGFMTGHSVGYLMGSIISGLIFDKMKGEKTYCVSSCSLALTVIVALIPWCSIYELMISIHVFKGMAGGGLDTTGNALLISLWRADGKSFMQSIHFAFAIGGAISPFVTAPFLAPDENTQNNTIPSRDIIGIASRNTTSDLSNVTQWEFSRTESRLYIPFSIAAFLAVTATVPLFVLACTSTRPTDKKMENSEDEDGEVDKERNVEKLSTGMKVLMLIIMMLLMGLYCAMEDGFNNFLATFCVSQLKWTKYIASVVTAVFWVSFTAGRFLGIFVARSFKPVRMIFILSVFLLVGFLGFFLTAHFKFYEGIWISTGLIGFSMSIIFPSIFSWTEDSILPVTGFIASLFLIASSTGSMINPIILGFLMDNSTPMWFTYIMLGESVIMLMVFFLVWTIANRIKLPKNTFKEVKIEIRSEDHDDIEYRSIIAESEINEDRL
ncbi:sodium-dependent glucose transporter 1A-like [Saccostrea echinata]|uniref:sodium-dependent glucose transporter 1A-like n=1 Tax=Saccostrea echinata TaxID=191078 RepID=UPI002A81F796|nr:sodium-dependent glucose transporter 1A-like [Saccostrea echinata]